ncbi:RNA-binding (RRM/RBD/RNP motifs) family protein [Raphanus sativus]|uniref:Organelle RRM domain-containing protein 1, chloroplastic n=1 Tax=Raphanus sativus TaxID=3726 RepID=A0A6J0LEJ7_RAPSA|nr:organelle RRM domain-containing protein 1, chloroplastic [Raphanus sativus]KAJ4912720.1 RNA-binding (RRM/RBD/RNP motifs) family protein [Raphanus sativus]
MWSATLAFPSFVASSTSLSSYTKPRLPKIQASLSNYPLASKIMVRNLPFSISEDFLQKEFSAFGEIAEVKLVKDESMKRSKGYAFIQYMSQDDAFLAIETMDRRMYNGRMIYIDIAKPGKRDFQQQPRTSGPPENQLHVPEEPASNEVADCWY